MLETRHFSFGPASTAGAAPSVRVACLVVSCLAAGAWGCGAAQHPQHGTAERAPASLSNEQLIEVATELSRRGDTMRAEQYYTQALAQGAREDDVLPRLLSAYIRDRQYQLAAQRVEDYLRRHPEASELRLLLAALCEALGNYRKAVLQYRAVLHSKPEYAEAHFALASALLSEGHDRTQADAHFRTYLALEPSGAHAVQARAALLKEVTP